MKTRINPAAAVIRALLSTLCLLLFTSAVLAQSAIGRPGNPGPSLDAKAPVIQPGVAERLVYRLQTDNPDLGPAQLYKLLEQDFAADGPYSVLAAGMIGGLYLTQNQKLVLLFAAGVAIGILLM